MSLLEVPGARLYYETRGSGPLLVMIPGATGDARVFADVGEHLAEHYTVLTYDRRGFSRSPLRGSQDYRQRLDTDADDVARLIEHHGPTPASVFGTSSGAVVAASVLARHPAVVGRLAASEPAAVSLLPDSATWIDVIEDLYRLYRDSGVVPAQQAFSERFLTPRDREFLAEKPTPDEHQHANATYWFERELRQYPAAALDIHALARHAERIVLLAGQASRGYPAYRVNAELGHVLGRDLIETPGGHIPAATHPAEFGHALHQALNTLPAHDTTTDQHEPEPPQ